MCYPVCGMVHIKDPLLLIVYVLSCMWDGPYKRPFVVNCVCVILSVGWCI